MSMDFFVMMVLLATPSGVVLSVCIGDFGCGQPMSMRELRRDHFFGTDIETCKFGFCGIGGNKLGGFSGCGLMHANFAESMKEFVVHYAGIV